jgi:hypothetical protein
MKHLVLMLALTLGSAAASDPMPVADLSKPEEATLWRFFTDQVMGGVSTGEARVEDGALALRGTVSTANRGGFIQVRREVAALPEGTRALLLDTRGDGQTYYIHLRTRATRLPWQYYQASFGAPEDWAEVEIPLDAFLPSGGMLPRSIRPETVRSVALVAYGRDHAAQVDLRRIEAVTE